MSPASAGLSRVWAPATLDVALPLVSSAEAPHPSSMETALYRPVKIFLQSLGLEVKGEVAGCDLVGLREGEPPIVVVCELKLRFNLDLVLQAVDRAAACDEVWLAARMSLRGNGRESDARFRSLCRRLGFGMLGIDGSGACHILVSPDAPTRRDAKRRSRIVDEHRKRRGDPMLGGGSRAPIMTAYRQQALLCAAAMADTSARPRDLKEIVPTAAAILARNVYGWFERVERGRYALTIAGRDALLRWPQPVTPVDGG